MALNTMEDWMRKCEPLDRWGILWIHVRGRSEAKRISWVKGIVVW